MDRTQLLEILSKEYPDQQKAQAEIASLYAYMALPKGTEYFFSDVHGEDKAFTHLVRSASGNIRRKIRDVFRTRLSEDRQNELASIIYEPTNALKKRSMDLEDENWVRRTILELVEIGRYIGSKYGRQEIRRKTAPEYRTMIEEMYFTDNGELNRQAYCGAVVDSLIKADAVEDFIISLCHTIQRTGVNHIHVIGDIFDRGPGPHKIMEELIDFAKVGEVDIQWGNHDVIWMGAALGNEVCMLAVLRIALRYNAFDALEDGYSIHLRQLNDFAQEFYGDDPCEYFQPRIYDENEYDVVNEELAAKMHKAITILELKLEGQLLKRHPEYEMEDRIMLEKIDYENGTIELEGKTYQLRDTNFPTIDPKNPLQLNRREQDVMRGIQASFRHSEPLRRHVTFMYSNGSSYLRINNNLLYHGCVPMTEEGEFDGIHVDGKDYKGKDLFDYIDYRVTQAYFADESNPERIDAIDLFWYLWCGKKSPMFGKSKMATFENYFIGDKELGKETYNPYFELSRKEEICVKILEEFEMDPEKSHIINGHVPVKLKKGDTPVRANGKLYVIDGGLAKAYQKQTGIAGYTLIFNSHHIALAEHQDFEALSDELETYSPHVYTVERLPRRMLIGDTDEGDKCRQKIELLEALIDAYELGELKEKFTED